MTTLESLLLILVLALIGMTIALVVRLRGAREQAVTAYAGRAEAVAVREALEAQIELGRQYLNALGESTSDALVLLDANRQVTWANAATWDLFNGGQPAIGHSFIALVRDFELNQALTDALAGNRAMMRQAAVGERTMRIWATPIETVGGAAVGMEDVTELQRLGRARRDFVANLSHEIRTPLSNIDLAAQTVRQSEELDPALRIRMLDQIQVQVQILSQLSQEMMELAQIESGQVLLKLVTAELEPFIRRTVTNLMPQAEMKNQHLSLLVPSGLLALVDEGMIGRVINNLVHNAIKFTPEGGTITVTAEANDEDVTIRVDDSGPGIPKEDQRRVFERFYKADRAEPRRNRAGPGDRAAYRRRPRRADLGGERAGARGYVLLHGAQGLKKASPF